MLSRQRDDRFTVRRVCFGRLPSRFPHIYRVRLRVHLDDSFFHCQLFSICVCERVFESKDVAERDTKFLMECDSIRLDDSVDQCFPECDAKGPRDDHVLCGTSRRRARCSRRLCCFRCLPTHALPVSHITVSPSRWWRPRRRW